MDYDALVKILESYDNPLIKTDSQPAEFNNYLKKIYHKRFHTVEAKVHKDLMMAQLQTRVLMTQLKISDTRVKLFKEMSGYRKGKRAGDNLVDALALACYEPIVPLDNSPPARITSIGPPVTKFPWFP